MKEIDIESFLKKVNIYKFYVVKNEYSELVDYMNDMDAEEYTEKIKKLYSLSKKSQNKLYKKLLNYKGYCPEEMIVLASIFLNKRQINNLIDNMQIVNMSGLKSLIIVAGRASEFINSGYCFEYGFSDSDVKDLIIATGNPEKYVNDERVRKLIADKRIIFKIICTLKNAEDYLDIKKLNEWGILKSDVINAIYQHDSYLPMELAVKNSDRLQLALDDVKKFKRIVETSKKIVYMGSYSEEEYNKHLLQCNSELSIPEEMKVGVEIESFGYLYKEHVRKYFKNRHNWNAKDDLSIEPNEQDEIGIEISSPILTGSCDKTKQSITQVCSELVAVGQKTNGTCGGHIHIDSSYLDNVHAYQNLLDLWCNAEKVIYIISNRAGDINREDTAKYAKPISKRLLHYINNEMIDFSDNQTVEDYKEQLFNFQSQSEDDFEYRRYAGINFSNIEKSGTIEFRVPNGSLNPDVWIQNINLFGGLIKTAQDLSLLQEKGINELTPEEYHKLELFEALKTEPLREEEKLHILLELVIPEKDRAIYENRFEKNRSLLRIYDGIDDSISDWITSKKVNLSPNVIGKRCFVGDSSLTMQELSAVDSFVRRELAGHSLENNRITRENRDLNL